jgi:arabinose-5-phosphate isomerase
MRQDWLSLAREVLGAEAAGLAQAAERLDEGFVRAVELILSHEGKVVLTGMGKSGHIARTLAATFSSTGTPAVFLHPAEAIHGDLGIVATGDPVVAFSNAGTTAELLRLVPLVRDLGSPLIGIVGNRKSPLAREVDVCLDASVDAEADPESLVPSASLSVALGIGHALAIALMRSRRFSADDFAERHPGGQLGRNLRTTVGEAMHRREEVAWVSPGDRLREIVIAMTSHPLGAACVAGEDDCLAGLITDGDLRRALQSQVDLQSLTAADIMTSNPVTVAPGTRLVDAMRTMENRTSQISLLPVVEPASGQCLGLIRIHDICQVWLK